jgi:polyisoprenoid-binding protein YceI
MIIGILSGAIAAIIASLLSLPLRSPDDAFFNTASVTIGALIAGVVAGGLRQALPQRTFIIVWGAAFLATVGALAVAESAVFERMLSFGAPIAAVVFLVTGFGVVALTNAGLARLPMIAGGAAVAALAIGLGLAGQGDGESGALALPAAPASPAATGTAAAATTVAAGATGSAASGTAARGADGLPAQFTTQADLKGVTFVVGEGSLATFTVNEKLAQLPLPNDAVMKSNALTGDIRLDGRDSKINLDLLTLTSDQPRRDNFVRERVFSKAPTAVLTVPTLTTLPERYQPDQVVKQTVQGTLAINGVERPVSFEVEARMDGTTLNVLGKTSFVWSDFNMTPPNTPSVSVQDRVAVEVLLAAKPKLA